MEKPADYQKLFDQILVSRRFSELDNYKNPETWVLLDALQKEKLAYLFSLNGQEFLKEGDLIGFECLKLAQQISPDNPKIKGLCSYFTGQYSEEAVDFNQAIHHFKKVSDQDLKDPQFLCHYGNALAALSSLIDQPEYLQEAISLYKQAAALDSQLFSVWFNLATAHQRLFTLKPQLDDFQLSDEYFTKALQVDRESALGWCRWGHLYLNFGKIYRDMNVLEKSLEKFEKAAQFLPNNPIVLRLHAEALMLLGTHQERLDRLRLAEKKIVQAYQIEPDNAEILYIHGVCLHELGRYFEDENFFKQSMDILQKGISINPKDPMIWHGLALVSLSLGGLFEDPEMFESAIHYCQEASLFGADHFPQFWNDWGVALMKLSEITQEQRYLDSAVDKFEQAIKRQGARLGEKHCEPEWFYNYACALDFLGDLCDDPKYYERAIHILTQIVALDSEFTHARYNLALAYSHLGELVSDVESYQNANEHFQILLEQDCEDEIAWNEWGLTLMNLAELVHDPAHPEYSKKLYEQAESKLSQAIALGNSHAYYSLACLYSVTGNLSSAVHYLERADQMGSMPAIDALMQDEWLEELRGTQVFRAFIAHLLSKQNRSS